MLSCQKYFFKFSIIFTNTARNLNIIDDNIPPERAADLLSSYEKRKSRFMISVIFSTTLAKIYYSTIITNLHLFVNICKAN